MLLHYSLTVLVTIIWTILLNISAQEIIYNETSVKRNGKNVISVHPEKMTDRTRDGENMINKDKNERRLNGGKEWFDDGTDARTITDNDMIEYPVTNGVEKHHVRGNDVSHEIASTRILTEKTMRKNAWLKIGDSKENINDDSRIFQHNPETSDDPDASFEGNIVAARGTARDTNSSKTQGSNISRAIMTKETKLKNNDNAARNGSLHKDTVETKGISKLSRKFEALGSTLLIIPSKASSLKGQMGNLSLEMRSYKQDYSTSEIAPKTRPKDDESALMDSASLNDNSSRKDQQFGEAIKSSNDDESNKTGNILSPEKREKFIHDVGVKMENENYENGEKIMENKMFVGISRESAGENAMIWKKGHIDNLSKTIRKKAVTDRGSEPNEIVKDEAIEETRLSVTRDKLTVTDRGLERNEIVKDEAIEETRLSIQRENLSTSKLSNDIERRNKEERKGSVAEEQNFSQKNEDFGNSSFSTLSPNSSKEKSNQVTTPSSVVYTSLRFITENKISAESTRELSGQIAKPFETPTSKEKLSLSTRIIGKSHVDIKPKDYFALTSNSKTLNEEKHFKNPRSSSLETRNIHNQQEQKWKLQKINDHEKERNERKSYFASWLNNEPSGMSTEKSRIVGGKKSWKNEISREGSYDDEKNNEKITDPKSSVDNVYETSRNEWKFVDNPTSTDNTSRIHRNVVKTMEGSKIESESQKKNLIGEKSTRVIDLQSDQNHRDWQGRKKQVEKISSDVRAITNVDGILVGKDEASWRKVPLVNSKASPSLWLVVKRENNVLDSIASVTATSTRRMEFSKSDGTRESSWRIKNDAGGDGGGGDGVEGLVFSKETTEVVPRSVQFLQSTAMESNALGDESVIVENRENFIDEIYKTSRSDELSSMDSTLAEVDPRDFNPNDDNHDEDEEDVEEDNDIRNDNGETSKVLDTSRSEIRKGEAFYQHWEKADSSQRKISLDVEEKFKVQSLPLAILTSDGSAATETDRTAIDTIDSHPENQKDGKIEWADSMRDGSMVKSPQAASSSGQHVTNLLNDRIDGIISVTGYETLVEATTKLRYDDHRPNDASQENYIRTSKIDQTHEAMVVKRLKLRDPNRFIQKDSREIQREARNHINDKMSNVKHCRACEIVEMMESNVKNENREKSIVSDGTRPTNRVNMADVTNKIEQSIIKVMEPLKSTIHAEITRKNESSADSEFMADDGHSLGNTSVKLKMIHHGRPDERVGERMQWKSMEILVRDQEPIINAAQAKNLIVSGKRVSALPRPSPTNIVKFSDTIEPTITLGNTFLRRNERIKSLSAASLDSESHKVNFHTPSRSTDEKKDEDIENFTENLTKGKKNEFSNNPDNIPRENENIRAHASSQMLSASDDGRRWKILFPDDETKSLIKIDGSIVSIDRPSRSDGSPPRKYLVEHSQSDVRPGGTFQNILNPSNVRTKQIKRGFVSEETLSFPIMEKISSRIYGSIASTDTPEVRYGNSLGTISNDPTISEPSGKTSRLIEMVKSSKNDIILTNETSFDSMANLTNVTSPYITEVATENPYYVNQFESSNPYNSLNQSDESSKTHRVINKIPSISMTHPTNVDSFITYDPTNYNLTHENTSVKQNDNSTLKSSSRESMIIEPTGDKKEPREMVDDVAELYDALIQNQTMKENSSRQTMTLNQWPVKHSAVVEGDLVLGGLMMVHEREDSVTCGPVMPQGGVQALEAMLYTLDWLNNRDLVPGVKIGAHILDDCDKDTYGLEMAVDFIKGSISNIDGAEYHCNKTAVRKVISGVVGAASSVTSIQVANLLRLFRIPQVSFFSTSPELSNKMRFEYFTRTIPSDHYQVKAMVDIVLIMGWSYVSIIYEESNYGEKAYEELEKLLGKHQICIAVKEKLSKDSGVAEAHVYDNIVLKLLTKPRARGCIIFASDQEVAGVMRAVRRCNATGAFSWIGSDGWSARSLVSDGNEPEMEGTLSVQPQANPVEGFKDYFLNLTVENNRRNPWFVEFWEDHFKCRYPNASQTPYNNYTDECTTTERLTRQNTAFEDQLQFVSDAVLAFAYAFRNMHSDLCHGKPGLCDAMKPTKGTELLGYLRRVKFEGLSGDVFRFDKNGDGPARYNIIHFKQISPGKYKWIRVGEYLEGELRLNMSEIQFRLGHPQAPESVCSLPCEVGQAKKYVEGESCCWHCFNCTQYQIRHINDEKQCVLCPQGTVPDETHSYCRDIPEEFLRPESGWAIGAMSFSSTGILITLFVGGVFLKHNDTPIVRASGRELSYVLLTGILLCYLVTFALVLKPTDLVCSIQRFSAGFCFTVVYAALLTKTNRISRIFNAGKRSAKRPSFISPRSQLIICSMLVAIQILINAVWMVIDPAKARHHYPTREDNLLVCNSYIDASYMIAFTYPIILIVVCTVYAVLTRKIPEAFNESKHIGFTMYTTCVIWLAFVPLYFATGSHVALRITSMSVTISLSASVTIACLFTPKLYIILIHPERNVRPNMMHQRYNTTKGSVVTATNASSMMAPVTLTAVTCDQNKAVKKHVITTMDCSTQSEQFELEMKDRKNGKLAVSVITRSTQTLLNNNGKDSSVVTSSVIKDISIDENICTPIKILNMSKIGNGPFSQNEVPL